MLLFPFTIWIWNNIIVDAVYVNSAAEQHAPVAVVSNPAHQQPISIPAREMGPDEILEIGKI